MIQTKEKDFGTVVRENPRVLEPWATLIPKYTRCFEVEYRQGDEIASHKEFYGPRHWPRCGHT